MDIKASVDMAYLVTGQSRHGKLHRLYLDPFKSRIAPGKKFAMEYREGEGLLALAANEQNFSPDANEIIRTIVRKSPGSNGTQIKAFAKEHGISKNRVDQVLGEEKYEWRPGKGAGKLYSLRKGNLPISPTLE